MTASTTRSGLRAIATDADTFAIVAMDQRNTLKRMYHAVGIPDPSDEELVQIKADTVQALRGSASGYLLDPTSGTPALKLLPTEGPRYGVLSAAEPSERGTINGEPRAHREPALDAQWVKDQGGDALEEAVGMDREARQAYLADEGKRRLDNLVQVIDGRARPYTEVTTR